MNQNPDCGGSHCAQPTGEVRVLPTSRDSNAILCRPCFEHEMAWRRQENLRPVVHLYKLPAWDSLAVYKP